MTRRQQGFTFTEVTIAGAILTVGTVGLLQLTRQALDLTNPNDPLVPQNSQVVEQYMQAQVASIKAFRSNPVPPVAQIPIATISYGTGSLYVTIATSIAGAHAGTVGSNGAIIYELKEYDLKVQMSMAAHYAQFPVTDPVLAHTVFWKLGNDGSFKTAL